MDDGAGLTDLAERLASPSEMVLVPSKAAMLAYLAGLNQALGPGLENYGTVRTSDAPEPDPLGVTGPDGFRPWAFTSQALATDYARQAAGYDGGEAVLTQTKNWASGLGECLRRGYAGIVIDGASERAVTLDRDEVARVYALLTIEAFARLECLHALRAGGTYHVQRSPDGSRQAFVFDSREAGQHAIARMEAGGVALDIEEVGTYRFVRHALEAGVGGLVLNFGLPDERRYLQADMARMIDLIETSARAAAPPAPPAKDNRPATLRRIQSAPPMPPHAIGDEAAHALFTSLRNDVEQGRIAMWQFVEAFAFEMDVHVPVYGEVIDGVAWPQVQTDPDAAQQKMCATFTRVAEIRKALAGVHPNFRRFASLAGIEALRWVWSAPAAVSSIAVDYAQPGAFQFPMPWVRRVLFPAVADFDDLSKVPVAPWPQLGTLPGARGLKPRILRTLALGWKQLLSVKEPITVPLSGRRYVPVFSGQEQFFAFMSGPEAPRVSVDPAGSEPPYHRWLSSGGPCDGLLLDPAGRAPLPLDHTDVLVISAWATRPSTPPAAGDVLADGARLLAAGSLTAEQAGRLAADFPSYWFGVRQEAEKGFSVVTHNDTNYCLFTSEARAADYIGRAQNLVEGGFEPREAVTRWGGDTVFDHALRKFSQAVIDPDRPGSPAGLFLDRTGLEAALARVDDRLTPRVPGFIWGEPGFQA